MFPKSFKYWDEQALRQQFGLKLVKDHKTLRDWLNTTISIDVENKKVLKELQAELINSVDYWSEEDLKMYFLSPFLREVKLISDEYRMFFERDLKATINGIELKGVADMLVATGFQRPEKPYFFIHEFKPEFKRDLDPKGQLLAEMLAAQAINQNSQTIYGCYIIGRNWYFVILKGVEYSVSDTYVSTQEDIYQIFSILKQVKFYIEEIIKSNQNGN
jgi:hypothetical protein